ncbi:hypothetical protein A2U01_0089202, partial [Trifolium medium]|nr:hypothetical protein [Trifolium medium]
SVAAGKGKKSTKTEENGVVIGVEAAENFNNDFRE